MFGLFSDPFYDPIDDFFDFPSSYYYRPSFYDTPLYESIDQRLRQVLAEEFGIAPRYRYYPHIDILRRARQLQNQRDTDSKDHSEVKEKIKNEVETDAKKAEEAAPKPTPKPKPQPFQSLFYESRSSYDGQNYVEEHREKVTDTDGKVHQTTRRRLGDRWYEAESITGDDGKTSTKETWHNVPEDQIEKFKSEWVEKHNLKYEPKTEAIAHDEKKEEEKPKEEQKQ